jgi:hypothetical protein
VLALVLGAEEGGRCEAGDCEQKWREEDSIEIGQDLVAQYEQSVIDATLSDHHASRGRDCGGGGGRAHRAPKASAHVASVVEKLENKNRAQTQAFLVVDCRVFVIWVGCCCSCSCSRRRSRR